MLKKLNKIIFNNQSIKNYSNLIINYKEEIHKL